MRMTLTLGIFLLALSAAAREYKFNKKADPGALQTQLVAAGFKVRDITCFDTACAIRLEESERKDPKAVVDAYTWEDPRLKRKQELDALRALLAKWKTGTITPAEKDELLLRFVEMRLPAS